MFKFDELSDVEIEEYVKDNIGHTDEYQESLRKNTLLKNIDRALSSLKSVMEELKLVKVSVNDEDYEKAFAFGQSAYKKVNRCSNSICSIKEGMGVEERFHYDKDVDYNVTGDIQGDILHIILPDLLPDRVQQGEKFRYDEINHVFYTAFQRFFSKGRFPVYESKAVICFINVYESERQLKDHDNFEVKQVIDILSAFVLTDDNPKWCSHYMDYRMSRIGEKCHSEIYIVPQSRFVDFLNSRY